MNRSHLAALLVTVFGLAVLGAAAGTLHAAHPAQTAASSPSGSPGTSGSNGTPSNAETPTGTQSAGHYLLPDLSVPSGLATGSTHATSAFARLAIAALLLLVGGALVLWWLTGDDGSAPVEPTATPTDYSDDPTEHTRSPEATHVPADNDVYRAWQTMVAIARPDDSRHKTPRELADAAVDAGLPASAVRTITRLFRTVRYGDAPPTPDRERDARRALHTIRHADNRGETDDDPERPGK
ncbi:DUF4129 domain-containing protein [Halarchaeum nitratireducens]|uniref:Protein-glutamine gamma-glutamyltransferase-like C-terminal domain-containing protein n=1 Tax=Halarchaeum nitratireducens TaxID=489913 RepID=A0A830GEY8_9EURY|nr:MULTISPECIES: DUF4129 domain-containing protein [Halarchaeum]MBP2251094.1 hypothetical protein [Halarchaeum solikamskense]GGN22182.1 hypothetical protein GCM10009021_24550 [Halarchaeum nitratireducens]